MTQTNPGHEEPIVPHRWKETVRTIALVGLFLLASMAVLEVAEALILPIVVALMLEFLFRPLIRGLRRHGIPEALSSGVVMLGFLGLVFAAGYSLAAPAAEWSARGPTSLAKVETKVRRLLQPLARFQQTAAKVEQVTQPSGRPGEEVRLKTPSLAERLSGSTVALLEGLGSIVFLTFFMLASGDRFMQRLVGLLPTLSDKKKAVKIARDIESQVSTYMVVVTLMNLVLGLITWLVLAGLGMPNAGLWGFVAGLLNYVPYVGAVVTVIVIGIAALATFDNTGQALLMPSIFLGLHLIEANLVKPYVLGRRLPINQTALFIGIMFWWYLWGTAGAILAVPILVTLKVVCDHVETLRPLSTFLGNE